eukprot:CAMPEP_0197646264 /NCGR_PEP_ID=MMETSP1338-20131121/22581_1 /TAXON_ID=43686 ORGANISM="Pelagodinium beii, Strain RCC1491" /NCGR_SAMPLE_ID=MMETSP1338 /ASSEMBLY_ACC=CAM_ASM_000754 /LENGTH=310 /DNA_ID=CAMNT_0043219885 /DNA_START=58 /DNA_END=990 /DNA_ORIENTATION=-
MTSLPFVSFAMVAIVQVLEASAAEGTWATKEEVSMKSGLDTEAFSKIYSLAKMDPWAKELSKIQAASSVAQTKALAKKEPHLEMDYKKDPLADKEAWANEELWIKDFEKEPWAEKDFKKEAWIEKDFKKEPWAKEEVFGPLAAMQHHNEHHHGHNHHHGGYNDHHGHHLHPRAHDDLVDQHEDHHGRQHHRSGQDDDHDQHDADLKKPVAFLARQHHEEHHEHHAEDCGSVSCWFKGLGSPRHFGPFLPVAGLCFLGVSCLCCFAGGAACYRRRSHARWVTAEGVLQESPSPASLLQTEAASPAASAPPA